MSDLFPTPLETYMTEQGIPKEDWDKLPFGEGHNWTPVTEDMPGDDFLVNVRFHMGLSLRMNSGCGSTWQGKWRVFDYNGGKIESAVVTDWQELPEPINNQK